MEIPLSERKIFLKKLLNFGCGSMAYNQRYLGVAGNQIGLIDRVTGEVSKWHGAENIASLQMDDEYIYEKTTSGTYYVFNLETKVLQYKGYCREKKSSSHDGKFFLYAKGIVLDVLSFKNGERYIVKYNLETQTYERTRVSASNYVCKDWYVDYDARKAYLLFTETCCLNHEQTNCYISSVNIDTLQIETETLLSFEHGVFPIGLLHTNLVLLNNMQIADTAAPKRICMDSNNYFQNKTYGYFVRLHIQPNRQILFVFSKGVLFYDYNVQKLLRVYPCQYGDNAMCLDGKIFIATWNGLFSEPIEIME